MEDSEFNDHDEFDDHEDLKMLTLEEALRKAEEQAATTRERPELDYALELALMEAVAPAVKETWRGIDDKKDDMLNPSRKLAALTMPDCDHDCDWVPQAVGHALVQACQHGLLLCVRRLREIQRDRESGSLMVALFNAFGLLKAAEAGHEAVVSELLTPMASASTALMGYMVATKWKDGIANYPFVTPPPNPPNASWISKLANSKSALPPAVPIFQAGWELKGSNPGMNKNLHEVVRASYKIYLLWRIGVIVGTKCHVDVFRILLKKRFVDNLFLKETLAVLLEKNASGMQDGLVKRMVADRAKMDTAMYQLVEEYSTKNYNDAMLYTLWKCCVGQETSKDVGKPKCVAEAHDGMWEIKLEVPLLMMQVEHAHKNEEPKDRYKQLTMLYPQTAQLSIQLDTKVQGHSDFLQVEVKIKHVRLKAENSRWDDSCMGHFPTGVTVSVLPLSDEGSSVTLTNNSHNAEYTVGRSENVSAGSSLTAVMSAAMPGFGAGVSASAAVSSSILMKSNPWRFEQVPLPDDDRGGSFKWTLQAMKGISFDRSNPIRMASESSVFKWGRRVPSNPLDELPFTSEGGVQFTNKEFTDAMLWRFPRDLESKTLRWLIQGEIYTTYTTNRYFETRMATFSGEVEDVVKVGKANFETTMKDFKEDVQDILGMKDKDDAAYKTKKEKKKVPTLEKFNTTQKKQFMQWLEFQKALEEMQATGTPKPVVAGLSMTALAGAPTTVEEEDGGGGCMARFREVEYEDSEEEEEKVEEEEVVGSQIVELEVAEMEQMPVSTPSLSRLTATKGKSWFRR